MSSSACPVCTLYLREGISLHDHLNTHPKEQVIEALIKSQESQQFGNVPDTNATTVFQTAPQSYPIQQPSGSAFTFQHVIPNTCTSAPVTMLMQPNSNSNLMFYNPFVVQQQQQKQKQLHIVNTSNNVHIQRTTLQSSVFNSCNFSANPHQQAVHSSEPVPVSMSTPLPGFIAKTLTTQPVVPKLEQVPVSIAGSAPVFITKTQHSRPIHNFDQTPLSISTIAPVVTNNRLQSESQIGSLPKGVISAVPALNNNNNNNNSTSNNVLQKTVGHNYSYVSSSPNNALSHSTESPSVRCPTEISSAVNSVNHRSKKMQIVHIIPNNGQTPQSVTKTLRYFQNVEKSVPGVTQPLPLSAPKYSSPQLASELRDLLANKTIELTPLPPTSMKQNVISPTIIIKDEEDEHPATDVNIFRKRGTPLSISGTSRKRASSNMMPVLDDIDFGINHNDTDLCDKEYYKSQPSSSRHRKSDASLSTIQDGSELNYCDDSQDYPTDTSCSPEQKSDGARHVARRFTYCHDDFTCVDSKDEVLNSTGQPDQKSGRNSPALSYVSRTETVSPGLRIRTDLNKTLPKPAFCKFNVESISSTDQRTERSPSPALLHKSGRNSPASSYNSGSESGSPGLRIRTDLSNNSVTPFADNDIELISPNQRFEQSVGHVSNQKSGKNSPSFSHVSRRRRSESSSPGLKIHSDINNKTATSFPMGKSPVEMIRDLLNDPSETSELVQIVRNNIKIQMPPTQATDNEEYITSDCTFNPRIGTVDSRPKTSSQMVPKSQAPLFSKNNFDPDTCKETTSYDASRPVNIIEVDGLHIVVPRRFYEPEEATDRISTVESDMKKQESSADDTTKVEPVCVSEGEAISQSRQQHMQNHDLNGSTSYDLLARENWIATDGSDNDEDGGCNISLSTVDRTWEDVVESHSPYSGSERPPKVYKCAVCKETFNCPKERRVHRRSHVLNKDKANTSSVTGVAFEAPNDIVEHPEVKVERVKTNFLKKVRKSVKPKQSKQGCRVLFVKNEATKFMGVFVKEDGIAQLEDEIEQKCEDAQPAIETKETKLILEPKPENPVQKFFQCLKCVERFNRKKLLIAHVSTQHSDVVGKLMCDKCQEIFPDDAKYQMHMRIHPMECTVCEKTFSRRQNLLLHMKRHLGVKPYQCTTCTKAFITKQKLNEHVNSHTGEAPIKCPLCDAGFRRYSNLIQHKNRFHYKLKKKVKDYVCFCGEIFHSKKKLDWHKEIHERKPKCCTFCSERFVHAASLTRHIRRAHDRRYMPKLGRENENIECAICGHVFIKSSLYIHMKLHSGERAFSCAVCGKTFTTKWNLQQHRWTHASRSNKPYKCTLGVCKSAFSRETDYIQHMDSHRNKRQFTCNVCGEQFVRKTNCLRHVKEHESAKTFACTQCGKTFHRGYYLTDHMRVHTGLRPFSCHICGKSSSTKSNHNKHVKIHHAREPVNTEA